MKPSNEFQRRHIGPRDDEIKIMLSELALSSLEELADAVIPKSIRTRHDFAKLGSGQSEYSLLERFKKTLGKNQIFKSLIGAGFHDSITPSVILRNIFENPVWYTAYTPYQPEISQGRLEALLNFQTVIQELTGMEIANASLLDEGTAVAEAVSMAHNISKVKSKTFLVSPDLHPHVLGVLKTRSESLGLEMIVSDPLATGKEGKDLGVQPVFAAVIAYPGTEGEIPDPLQCQELSQRLRGKGALLIADVDLLSLTLLSPPGEWGADIVVGNSQRFGVPLGCGGPHAAFLSTRDAYKRFMPGRLVGVSVDAQGRPALRLALQTREQHIRREKATSNVCTAQVLLANMAGMYAVYHGPEGLKAIASRIHALTGLLYRGLKKLGYQIKNKYYFDTLTVQTEKAGEILSVARQFHINLGNPAPGLVTVALNETTDEETVAQVIKSFNLDEKTDALQEKEQIPGETTNTWPAHFQRAGRFLNQDLFSKFHSETGLLRYIHSLQNKDLTLTHSMIPLGSCTMKLNATTELLPVSWPEVSRIHPLAPLEQRLGYHELVTDLEDKLADITGFSAVTIQPNAGSQGEYAGLLVIRAYQKAQGEGHRRVCLIPSSAHGTNPATAVMAGMDVVVVICDSNGNVDVGDLKAKAALHKNNLSALMITYPSTHGVFEESITEICQVVHEYGGQVYMDGANLNALIGFCRPGEFGPDVCHMNLHKSFAIPHGGGGPGVGPIGVASHLKNFLPSCAGGIGPVSSAPWGSASILPISLAYIYLLGLEGLRKSTLIAILNANYVAKKLNSYFPVLYKGKEGLVAHECILDLRPLKIKSGVDVNDVAKRLMDFGFHAPTMSFPVPGTLMVEPTESESKQELDRFIEAMKTIHQEIMDIKDEKMELAKSPLLHAPHTAEVLTKAEWDKPYSREVAAYPIHWVRSSKYWPPVSRVDNAYGDRHLICSCTTLWANSRSE